jgi:PEP-CTERM motif
MKYAFYFLLITIAMVVTLFADNSNMPSAAQRISNFVSGGPGSNTNQPSLQSGHDFNFSFNGQDQTNNNFQFSSSDVSSFFSALSSMVSQHHFDPNSLNDLQAFISTLHLDPALSAKVQMFVQNLQNGNFQEGDNNSGSDENANNTNSGSDENADNDNNSGSDENADNNDSDNETETGDIEDVDEPVAVPEPGTFVLMAAGAAMLAATFIRRRAK